MHAHTLSSWMGGFLQEDAAPSCGGSCGHEDTVLCLRAAGHNGQQKLKGHPRGAAVQTQVEIPERMCNGQVAVPGAAAVIPCAV